MLDLFVGNIDEKLLKWVVIKVLKPKDVQNPNFELFASRHKELEALFSEDEESLRICGYEDIANYEYRETCLMW